MKRTFTLLLITFCMGIVRGQFNQEIQGKADHPVLPDLFRYKVEEKAMFKIDFLNLIRRLDENGILGVIHIGYERKLGLSWSLNTELGTSYFFQMKPNGSPQMALGQGAISFALSPRYYFDMKKRIRNGKSLNNMSANYLAMSVSTRLMQLETGTTATDNGSYLYSDNLGIAPLFGFQRRLMDRGYVDFNIGARVSYGDGNRSSSIAPREAINSWQIYPVTNLRMGLAF